MAGRKNSRTSKTDHVLSLLAGTTPENPAPSPGKAAGEPVPAPAAQTPGPEAPARHAGIPPILEVARANNEALSDTIREALTENLEQELAQQEEPAGSENPGPQESPVPEEAPAPAAPVLEETPVLEEVPASAETPVLEEVSAPEEVPVPEEAPTPAAPVLEETPVLEEVPAPAETPVLEEVSTPEEVPVPEEAPVPAAAPVLEETPVSENAHTPEKVPGAVPSESGPGRTLPDGAVSLNVMELLVEDRIEKYVKLFGLCGCARCRADVRALALSRLPAKYVVLPGPAVRPMLSMYEAKFESAVIAQVIYACKAVMESPRHTL